MTPVGRMSLSIDFTRMHMGFIPYLSESVETQGLETLAPSLRKMLP